MHLCSPSPAPAEFSFHTCSADSLQINCRPRPLWRAGRWFKPAGACAGSGRHASGAGGKATLLPGGEQISLCVCVCAAQNRHLRREVVLWRHPVQAYSTRLLLGVCDSEVSLQPQDSCVCHLLPTPASFACCHQTGRPSRRQQQAAHRAAQAAWQRGTQAAGRGGEPVQTERQQEDTLPL